MIKKFDIFTAHVPQSRLSRPGDAVEPSVVVRFTRCTVRNKVFHAKHHLRANNADLLANQRVFVNEDLIDKNSKLLSVARTIKGLRLPIVMLPSSVPIKRLSR